MNNTLLDNSCDQLKMVNVLKQCIADTDCKEIQIATGYWDIPGTLLLLDELKNFLAKDGTTVQLLIGADPIVRSSQLKNPIKKDAKFPQDYIKRDIQNLNVTDEYVNVINFLEDNCKEEEKDSKLQIRIYKQDEDGNVQFFHAKCFIFSGNGKSLGIIGSSNFTKKGLEGNSELNYMETNSMIVTAQPNNNSFSKGHKFWFDEKWKISTSWNKIFLEEIIKDAPVTIKAHKIKSLTPYELYIKLLQYKFDHIVDIDQQKVIQSYLPQRYTTLNYQIDAVKQCFSIMKEHGGFMLGDVVGLGKTIVGTLIIKHFLMMPDDSYREKKVLIITPPAIKSSWIRTIKEFDLDQTDKIMQYVDMVTTGSIGNLVDDIDDTEVVFESNALSNDFEYQNYGMILIDESHKFRNRDTLMYKSLDDLIQQIGSNTGIYPYIGLLSATLQNNRPSDLQNQIYLFERNRTDSTLKKASSGNIEGFFSVMNKKYDDVMREMNKASFKNGVYVSPELRSELKYISAQIRDCVLQDILVRRTRTDVQKYYSEDIAKQNIVFPKISGPHSLVYTMEQSLAKLFHDTMNIIVPSVDFEFDNSDFLCYYRYRAIEFLKSLKDQELYRGRKNMDAKRFSKQLAKIMQINLVKRLESSFSAFKSSLNNLRQYTQNMIDMWDNDTIFICPDININAELNREKRYDKTGKLCTLDECINDIREKIDKLNKKGRNEKEKNHEYKREDFREEYIQKIKLDLQIIDFLCKRWNQYSNDPKLEIFKKELRSKLFDININPSQKLVVFTEAIDTVNAIKLAIESTDSNLKVLLVTANNRDALEKTIQENFDANYDGVWKDDFQVIVTTEVLAEGVNLHRANCILNYDTPWNATRLMQRIGRVNRIGSTAEFVYVFNFMPSAEGENEINLVKKAYTKLQSFHTLFGEDSQVFTEDEEVMHYDLNTQINGEESPMQKYIYELKKYKDENQKRYKEILSIEEGLEQAVDSVDGNKYFLIRNNSTSGMYVKLDKDRRGRVISLSEMIESFRVDKNAISVSLPGDWDKCKKEAELVFNRSLSKMNSYVKKSPRATRAKEVIIEMNNHIQMSEHSKKLLDSAFKLVNKGNYDIINKVIRLYDNKIMNGNTLFDFSQEDFDTILEKEIQKIIDAVQQANGKAETYIAICK